MAKILIVDDNADDRELLARILSSHDVTCAPNGREALAQILRELPDVVVLDLVMPEMDGPCFLEVVRSYLKIRSLPVVIYTGMVDSPMLDRVTALKVNSMLLKGKAGPDDIRKAVEEAMARIPG
jgi:CheY-like chemotaxis protein